MTEWFDRPRHKLFSTTVFLIEIESTKRWIEERRCEPPHRLRGGSRGVVNETRTLAGNGQSGSRRRESVWITFKTTKANDTVGCSDSVNRKLAEEGVSS